MSVLLELCRPGTFRDDVAAFYEPEDTSRMTLAQKVILGCGSAFLALVVSIPPSITFCGPMGEAKLVYTPLLSPIPPAACAENSDWSWEFVSVEFTAACMLVVTATTIGVYLAWAQANGSPLISIR
jgi:hypothetical protein